MEEEKIMEMPVSRAGAQSSSRWNPTKEQISVLEGLYRQGVRTPSAEHIQQITSRLRAYGHIEGKNVFYWFQNHKARQRQKQKQENTSCYNRFLRNKAKPSILSPPPCPNVSFYPHHPRVVLPGGLRRRIQNRRERASGDAYEYPHPVDDSSHETLQLFPLHPTGILDGRSEDPLTSDLSSSLSSEAAVEEGCGDHTLYDFFGNQRSLSTG